MKLAFFDTKPYDKPGFDEHAAGTDIEIKYFETKLERTPSNWQRALTVCACSSTTR